MRERDRNCLLADEAAAAHWGCQVVVDQSICHRYPTTGLHVYSFTSERFNEGSF